MAPLTSNQFGDIQGNILAGFFKDHQTLLFLRFTDGSLGRRWVQDSASKVATTAEVQAFNDAFRLVGQRHGPTSGTIKATWMNIAFSFSGLQALGVDANDLAAFPDDFKSGMAQRASQIGDDGPSAPNHWLAPLGSTSVHAVIILAADDPDDLARATDTYRQSLPRYAIELLFEQAGETRPDLPGHEHFGFDDGVSQPGILGFTPPGADADHGLPGQDLIQAGEFVIGYDRQPGPPPPPPAPEPGQYPGGQPSPAPTPDPGPPPVSNPSPSWTLNGSYLVFRRLRQDVPAFDAFVTEQAVAHSVSEDMMGAKLVGRYRSGAPLAPLTNAIAGVNADAGDPSVDHPEILQASHINDFEYAAQDPDGNHVPRAAHIRKAYPRDEVPPGEAETQTHRLLRRGIPYGAPYSPEAPVGHPAGRDADRGLLFLCYQTDITRQFEFVQNSWVNAPDFPQGGDGHDPIISQKAEQKSFTLPSAGAQASHISFMQRWVTTTGGEYFFQPSISALGLIGGVPPAGQA